MPIDRPEKPPLAGARVPVSMTMNPEPAPLVRPTAKPPRAGLRVLAAVRRRSTLAAGDGGVTAAAAAACCACATVAQRVTAGAVQRRRPAVA